jgi:hypothetical protein
MIRWAITKRIEAGEDLKPARTEVISIHSREEKSGPPSMVGLVNSPRADRYKAIEIPGGVVVGMVKGGRIDAAGGYGWPEETDRVVPQIDDKPSFTDRRRMEGR